MSQSPRHHLRDKRDAFCRVLWAWLLEDGPSTASELAAKHPCTDRFGRVIGPRNVDGIRPRLTELLQARQIRDTGLRRNGGPRGPKEKVFEAVNRWEESGQPVKGHDAPTPCPPRQTSLLEEYGIA